MSIDKYIPQNETISNTSPVTLKTKVSSQFSIQALQQLLVSWYDIVRSCHIWNIRIWDIELGRAWVRLQQYDRYPVTDTGHRPFLLMFWKWEVYDLVSPENQNIDTLWAFHSIWSQFLPKIANLTTQEIYESLYETSHSLYNFHVNILKGVVPEQSISTLSNDLLSPAWEPHVKRIIENIVEYCISTNNMNLLWELFNIYVIGWKRIPLHNIENNQLCYWDWTTSWEKRRIWIEEIYAKCKELSLGLQTLVLWSNFSNWQDWKNEFSQYAPWIEGILFSNELTTYLSSVVPSMQQSDANNVYHIAGKDMGTYVQSAGFQNKLSKIHTANILWGKPWYALPDIDFNLIVSKPLRLVPSSLEERDALIQYLYLLQDYTTHIQAKSSLIKSSWIPEQMKNLWILKEDIIQKLILLLYPPDITDTIDTVNKSYNARVQELNKTIHILQAEHLQTQQQKEELLDAQADSILQLLDPSYAWWHIDSADYFATQHTLFRYILAGWILADLEIPEFKEMIFDVDPKNSTQYSVVSSATEYTQNHVKSTIIDAPLLYHEKVNSTIYQRYIRSQNFKKDIESYISILLTKAASSEYQVEYRNALNNLLQRVYNFKNIKELSIQQLASMDKEVMSHIHQKLSHFDIYRESCNSIIVLDNWKQTTISKLLCSGISKQLFDKVKPEIYNDILKLIDATSIPSGTKEAEVKSIITLQVVEPLMQQYKEYFPPESELYILLLKEYIHPTSLDIYAHQYKITELLQ